jgi:hypothetical protein
MRDQVFCILLLAMLAVAVFGQLSICNNNGASSGNACSCNAGYVGASCQYNNCAGYSIYGAGNNLYGAIGNGVGNWISSPYGPVTARNSLTFACVGTDFALLLDSNGYIYTMGSNQNGMLGIGKLSSLIYFYNQNKVPT